MKDSKFKRTRHQASLLRRQFLQGNTGLFSQALGEHDVAAIVSAQVALTASASILH